jgi:hypothetical protein
MTMFPCINTLFTVDLDGNFRTHRGTEGTAGAFSTADEYNRTVSFSVIFLGWFDLISFADINAEVAFFAQIPVDCDLPFGRHVRSRMIVLNVHGFMRKVAIKSS